jgi:hypothetical protein
LYFASGPAAETATVQKRPAIIALAIRAGIKRKDARTLRLVQPAEFRNIFYG